MTFIIGTLQSSDLSIHSSRTAFLKLPCSFPRLILLILRFSNSRISFTIPTFIPGMEYTVVAYLSGEVAISILRTENDEIPLEVLGYSPDETWNPMQNPESVVISIISLLLDPNPDSAANVDAAIEFRENRSVYEEKVRSLIRS
ncbi:hypothetical protein RCL1_008179 [Eukaryota sp. TZLM3-RCL]